MFHECQYFSSSWEGNYNIPVKDEINEYPFEKVNSPKYGFDISEIDCRKNVCKKILCKCKCEKCNYFEFFQRYQTNHPFNINNIYERIDEDNYIRSCEEIEKLTIDEDIDGILGDYSDIRNYNNYARGPEFNPWES